MSNASCTIELSDDSSNDSASNQSSARPPIKNIAVKRGAPQQQPAQTYKTYVRAQINKKDREVIQTSSKFLNDFNPLTSRREKNKRKQFVGTKVSTKKTYYTCLYDEHGKLKSTNQDLCDCFDLTCEGCHFPCTLCGSQKCAIKCRNNRRFMYEAIEYDGKDTVLKNPSLCYST